MFLLVGFFLASLIVIVSVWSSCWILTFYSDSIDGLNICHNNNKSHGSNNIAGLTNTVTPSCVGKCLRLTFSSDLEEAMFETGKSLSAISKFDSVLEKNQPIYIRRFCLTLLGETRLWYKTLGTQQLDSAGLQDHF